MVVVRMPAANHFVLIVGVFFWLCDSRLACKQIHTGGNRPRRLVSTLPSKRNSRVCAFSLTTGIICRQSLLVLNSTFGVSIVLGAHHYCSWNSRVSWLSAPMLLCTKKSFLICACFYEMLQKVVEAFIIILALFELLYLLSLHLGFGRAGSHHGAGTGIGMGGVGHGHGHGHGSHDPSIPAHNHEHHVDYGRHTDMKIPVGHVHNPAHPTTVWASSIDGLVNCCSATIPNTPIRRSVEMEIAPNG